jgi:hypothetical protein
VRDVRLTYKGVDLGDVRSGELHGDLFDWLERLPERVPASVRNA